MARKLDIGDPECREILSFGVVVERGKMNYNVASSEFGIEIAVVQRIVIRAAGRAGS